MRPAGQNCGELRYNTVYHSDRIQPSLHVVLAYNPFATTFIDSWDPAAAVSAL